MSDSESSTIMPKCIFWLIGDGAVYCEGLTNKGDVERPASRVRSAGIGLR